MVGMALTKIDPRVPTVRTEFYSSDKINRDTDDIRRIPVLSKIEEALGDACKFSLPSPERIGRSTGGSSSSYQNCSANFYSECGDDVAAVSMDVSAEFGQPGAYFTGRVQLKLSYDENIGVKDLRDVKRAIINSGLGEGELHI